jgi:ankyrin repeat protein
LARWPEIGRDSLFGAVATGNVAEVERRLVADPAAANRKGGPLNREPLLYLAHSRLPGSETNGLEIAQLLLDHGADPNARWIGPWGEPAFTVLTGLIGAGEGNHPPHPQAQDLATLLIDCGADPYDPQALYNTSLWEDDITWLEFLWSQSERHGRLEAWRELPATPKIGGAVPTSALDYLLGNAVPNNHLRRAEWLLAHGAHADSPHAYASRPLREEALVLGFEAMAALLVRHGAATPPLGGKSAFRAACMRLDREEVRELARLHPEVLTDAEAMLTACRRGRTDIADMLLELGVDVDVADEAGVRGLQCAVAAGSLETVKLLVAHGANIDRPTQRSGGGALGYAAHFGRREIAEYLAPLSRDVYCLVDLGFKDRLAELFAAEPGLVNLRHSQSGCTPLFWLPDDEEQAMDMAAFLLGRGADPDSRDTEGMTAEERLRRRGLVELAEFLREESGKRDSITTAGSADSRSVQPNGK